MLQPNLLPCPNAVVYIFFVFTALIIDIDGSTKKHNPLSFLHVSLKSIL